jgi:hypothetical protein
LLGCSGEPAGEPTPGSDGSGVLATGDAHFEVSFAAPSGSVGRLVGWNIGRGTYYAPDGSPFHPEWRKSERVDALRRLAEVVSPGGPPPYVRFSGLQIDGSLGADGYHFWNYARPDRTAVPTDNMSVADYSAITAELGGEQTVTVNFGSGTSAEAARYATYLLGTDAAIPEVAARIASGRNEPYGVRAIEIGNEVYGFWNTGNSPSGAYSYANPGAKNGGDTAWLGKPSNTVENFGARALEYVHAVEAVAPGAKFWVPLSQASMDAWGGLDASIAGLEQLLREPAVDAVVIHFYETDDAKTLGFADANAPELMVAGGELFRPRLGELRRKLDALGRTPPVGIAVTEYHVASGLSHATFRLGDTAAVGLALADMMVTLAETGVDHAMQHLALPFEATQDALVETWYSPFRDEGGTLYEMPSYSVTRLFAEHVRARRVDLVAGKVPAGGTLADEPYDAIHAVAFASDDGREGTVFLTQRDLSESLRVTFEVDEDFTTVAAREWAPDAIDQDATTGTIPIADLSVERKGRRVGITAHPHSVVAVRFERE